MLPYIIAFVFFKAPRLMGVAGPTALKTMMAYREAAALVCFCSVGNFGFVPSSFAVSGLCAAVGWAVNTEMPDI